MAYAYVGKLLLVDLTMKTIEEKQLSEDFVKKYIGGYGIGARLLYDMIKPDADPLGPDNVIGFLAGLVTGTGALFGGRYTVVCKSPVTGGWNDSNSGGFFGPELKRAGFDGVIVSGASDRPVYIFINDGKVELRDANAIWGKTTVETLAALIEETGEKKLRAVVIGPAGESLSLMSCVMNDGHRAAGRGGCGAVMGSKKLKAVVVRGTGKISIADPEGFKAVTDEIAANMKGPAAGVVEGFGTYGTGGRTGAMTLNGDCPVKNWGGAGITDMGEEEANKLSTPAYDKKYNRGKYGCAACPLRCGARYEVNDGKWPVGATDRPEYETIGAFGSMMLNSDVESIIKCNDICNKYGLDTISTGATVAWAMECYENGILSREDTDGIELTWGNSEAIVKMTEAIANQEGFGKILALGSAAAARKIGKGAEYVQGVQGIEFPMHDPRYSPGLARTYQYDPTPARHVKGGMGLTELRADSDVRYNYEGKGAADAALTFATEIMNCAGFCMFGAFCAPAGYIVRYMAAATGWEFSDEDVAKTGKRILNMRLAFNLKAGLNPVTDNVLPPRAVGRPPLDRGPLKDIVIDKDGLRAQFCAAVGWDKESLKPTKESLLELGGLEDVAADLYT